MHLEVVHELQFIEQQHQQQEPGERRKYKGRRTMATRVELI